MKDRLGFALALAFVLSLTGCPFESHVPIAEPRPGAIDPRLVGLWSWTDPADGDVPQVLVLPFNQSEYYAELREKGKDPEHLRAYVIVVGGQPFLTINELTSDGAPGSYLLARYSIAESGELSLRFVGENAVPKSLASDPKALLDLLTAHLKDNALDDEGGPIVLRRADPGGAVPPGGSRGGR